MIWINIMTLIKDKNVMCFFFSHLQWSPGIRNPFGDHVVFTCASTCNRVDCNGFHAICLSRTSPLVFIHQMTSTERWNHFKNIPWSSLFKVQNSLVGKLWNGRIRNEKNWSTEFTNIESNSVKHIFLMRIFSHKAT